MPRCGLTLNWSVAFSDARMGTAGISDYCNTLHNTTPMVQSCANRHYVTASFPPIARAPFVLYILMDSAIILRNFVQPREEKGRQQSTGCRVLAMSQLLMPILSKPQDTSAEYTINTALTPMPRCFLSGQPFGLLVSDLFHIQGKSPPMLSPSFRGKYQS